MLRRKRLVFGIVFGVILTVATLVGVEFMSSFYVPSWPARALNPREPAHERTLGEAYKNQPWMTAGDKSWGMRDRERTIAKPPETFRTVFVGDSFVESWFTPLSLPAAVEQRVGQNGFEAVSLGVAATDPRSYYYRINDVALDLHPDAAFLFLYAGNDFMAPDAGYTMVPRLIDESPGGSLIGSIMPRTNWLLVNRLDLAAFFKSRSNAPANDENKLYAAVMTPDKDERMKRVVDYVKTYHYPERSEKELTELFSRGDGRYIDIARTHNDGREQEYMLDWMFDIPVSWELRDYAVPKTREEAVQMTGNGEGEATLSWIKAMDDKLRRRNIPFVVFLVPTGSVDPEYAEFWKPWPRVYSWNYTCDERDTRLAAAMGKDGIKYVDLRENLANVPGTYRKLDGHWTQKGEGIVADRVAREVAALKAKSPAP